MLNRRILRIKVMQTLYSYEYLPSLTPNALNVKLDSSIGNLMNIYLYSFLTILKVTQYATLHKEKESKKYIINSNEYNLSTKIADNHFIQAIERDKQFNELVKKKNLYPHIDKDVTRKLFQELIKHEVYQNFTKLPTLDAKSIREVMQVLFKEIMSQDELYLSHLEDHFPTWIDDQDNIQIAVSKSIDAYKGDKKPYYVLPKLVNWEETIQFGKNMLNFYVKHQADFSQDIEAQLKNWEAKRVSKIDFILMKMAVCEFFYFPSIPLKVSINEYVDIAKLYSTPKSKQFINGILDRLMKRLKEEGRISKLGRGLVGY